MPTRDDRLQPTTSMAYDKALEGCAYTLTAVIGRGGQGDVHASYDPVSGAPLAVKVLHRDAGRRARGVLSREYQLLRELDHPAFPEAYGFGHLDDGRAWLAMQYLPGVAAHAWARALGQPGTPERCLGVLAMMADVADAVGYLHTLGVVHGDIKPANLLVADDASPRVLDLGGASLDLGPGNVGRGFYHTAAYAAAEHFEKQVLTPAADVFSLAATAVRLLTDAHPFGGGTRDEIRARHEAGEAPVLEHAEALSEPLRALLLTALDRDPAARPRDGRTFAAALRALLPERTALAGRVSDAVPAPAAEAAREPPPPEMMPVLLATALGVAYPGGSVALATLASGLHAAAAAVRRVLDRLERLGWVARTRTGEWHIPATLLAHAQAIPEPTPGMRRHLAARLADEWEGDPLSPGRAYCQMVAERHGAAADTATRWARRMLANATIDTTGNVAAALEVMGHLDEVLSGPARTSWLLLRAHVAALRDAGDARVAAWLEQLQGGPTADAARATELHAAVLRWRGEVPPVHRAVAIAANELSLGRLEAALGLARTEVHLAYEHGDMALAAKAARVAGEALAGLGRLQEAARALADAVAWWPGREGLGQVVLARAEVLRALGRWAEAQVMLARTHREAHTAWDRAAATIGLAGLATDCGHPVQARRWLDGIDPAAVRAHRRVAVAHQVELLRAAALSGETDVARAERAEGLVQALGESGRHCEAARIGAWQAAVVWGGRAHEANREAADLVAAATDMLQRSGHVLWWAEAAIIERWLRRADGGGVSGGQGDGDRPGITVGNEESDAATPGGGDGAPPLPSPLRAMGHPPIPGDFRTVSVGSETDASIIAPAVISGSVVTTTAPTTFSLEHVVATSSAWPLGMRAALAAGDIHTAWEMATRFLAHLDPAQAAALELAPWAVRARHQTSPKQSPA